VTEVRSQDTSRVTGLAGGKWTSELQLLCHQCSNTKTAAVKKAKYKDKTDLILDYRTDEQKATMRAFGSSREFMDILALSDKAASQTQNRNQKTKSEFNLCC
jgi:hypothetical protein